MNDDWPLKFPAIDRISELMCCITGTVSDLPVFPALFSFTGAMHPNVPQDSRALQKNCVIRSIENL
jgi:hypothetical protein